MSWNIRMDKKYMIPSQIKKESKIPIESWRRYVENSDLIWAENSPIAGFYEEEGREWVGKSRLKMNAYFELNKNGYGNLRFKYFDGSLSIDCERQTLRRVERMWEVKCYFKGYLFKKGTKFTEKKLEKLRENKNKN